MRGRRSFDPEEARQTVPEMLDALPDKAKPNGMMNGAFCVVDQKTREFLVEPTLVGEVPEDKAGKYLEMCAEKALRLCDKYETEGHLLSWQSRNPEVGEWGGAVHDKKHAWAFSGLPEQSDEALMIMSAHQCGQISNGAPEEYAAISDNRVILDGEGLFWAHLKN